MICVNNCPIHVDVVDVADVTFAVVVDVDVVAVVVVVIVSGSQAPAGNKVRKTIRLGFWEPIREL